MLQKSSTTKFSKLLSQLYAAACNKLEKYMYLLTQYFACAQQDPPPPPPNKMVANTNLL